MVQTISGLANCAEGVVACWTQVRALRDSSLESLEALVPRRRRLRRQQANRGHWWAGAGNLSREGAIGLTGYQAQRRMRDRAVDEYTRMRADDAGARNGAQHTLHESPAGSRRFAWKVCGAVGANCGAPAWKSRGSTRG